MIKRQLLMVMIALVFGLLAEISVAPAAAPTCFGSGCNGLPGGSTGCSTGATVVSITPIYDISTQDYIGEVQLLWSSTCQAAWAWTYVGGDLVRPFFVQATVTSTTPPKSYSQTKNYAYAATSPMVYAANVSYARACGRIEDPGVIGSACTP